MAKNKLKVQVVISWYVHELIKKLHAQYPNKEWSGIARIQKRNGFHEVTDIRFPKQSNHWAETEMKDGGLESLLEDIFNEHPEQLGERKCWLHSHHSMGCFRSGTDEAAKRSFNDWMQDYRRSIVTAYKGNQISYKCALNVFKPVNIEFDVPVVKQEFDLDSYLQSTMKDYTVYKKAYQQLEAERDKELALANQPYQPTDHEVNVLIDIFNVENTSENRESCADILIKNNKGHNQRAINIANETFEDNVEELLSYFGVVLFSDKLKELEDNIIVPTFPSYTSYPKGFDDPWKDKDLDKEKPLFGEDDMKYKNHTNHSYSNWYGHGRDYYD